MEVERLEEFVVLAEKKRYSDAAVDLFISQSALSRHIKELEDELGVQLFERSAKSVELTWLGSQILGYARKMIALRDECMGMISDAVERMDNTVRISCTRNWSFTDFYKIVETFKKENPNYSMDIMQCTDHEVFKMMENGRAAIAFARELREKQTDGRI